MEGVIMANEITATETMAKSRIVNERELSVEELDAATGGVLPQGFMGAVWLGIVAGFHDAGGHVYLSNN